MKKFLSDYLNIIIYTIIGFTFMIASFYLMINYYHSQEIKTPIYVADNEIKYTSYRNTIQALDTSLSKYKRSDDKVRRDLYNKVSTCRNILKSEGTLYTLQTNQTLNSYDSQKQYYSKKIEEAKNYNETLVATKSNLDSKEYIEAISREKLDMYSSNERVYININK